MPRKIREPEIGAPLWMVSFADIMSLLLTFFVLLVTFSTFDYFELMKVYGALKGALGVVNAQRDTIVEKEPTKYVRRAQDDEKPITEEEVGPECKKFRESILAAMEGLKKTGLYEYVRIEFLDECISMKLLNPILFYPGESRMRPKGEKVLALMGEVVGSVSNDVRVIGFADPENADPESDGTWELAVKRAVAVAEFLVKRCDIRPERIAVCGWGAGPPEMTGESREGITAVGAELVLLARPRRQKPTPQEVIVKDDWR